MQGILMQLIFTIIGVLISKFIDVLWPPKVDYNYRISVEERSFPNGESFSKQVDRRIYESKITYYLITGVMLYFAIFAPIYFSNFHDIFLSSISNSSVGYSNSLLTGNSLFSAPILWISMAAYPVINIMARLIFSLLVAVVYRMGFVLTKTNLQQLRFISFGLLLLPVATFVLHLVSTYSWKSAFLIVLLVVGIAIGIAFSKKSD